MQTRTLWLATILGLTTEVLAGGVIERGRQIYQLPDRFQELDAATREQLERLRVERAELERQIAGLDETARQIMAKVEVRDAQWQAQLATHLAALNAQRTETAHRLDALTQQIVGVENALAAAVQSVKTQRQSASTQVQRWLWISALAAVAAIVRRPLGRVLTLLALRRLVPTPRRIKPSCPS